MGGLPHPQKYTAFDHGTYMKFLSSTSNEPVLNGCLVERFWYNHFTCQRSLVICSSSTMHHHLRHMFVILPTTEQSNQRSEIIIPLKQLPSLKLTASLPPENRPNLPQKEAGPSPKPGGYAGFREGTWMSQEVGIKG